MDTCEGHGTTDQERVRSNVRQLHARCEYGYLPRAVFEPAESPGIHTGVVF